MDNDPKEEPPTSPPPHDEAAPPAPEAPSTADPFDWLTRFGGTLSPVPQAPAVAQGEMPEQEEKMWGLFSHRGAIIGFSFLAPLVIYIIQKDKSPFVAAVARESLNFQITFFAIVLVCAMLSFLVIPLLLIFPLGLLVMLAGIVGSIRANGGKFIPMPFSFRVIK